MSDTFDNTNQMSEFELEKRKNTRSYSPPSLRDTSSVEVTSGPDDNANRKFKIPPSEKAYPDNKKSFRTSDYSRRGADFSRGHRKSTTQSVPANSVISEYDRNGLIKHVTVNSWPASYSFYEKFVRDAVISHSKKGSPAPHVPFFSYIPQYSQLTAGGYAYYQYMKEQIKNGVRLPDADFSYVLLYVYEIINLEGYISPLEGAELLAKTWVLYRPMHPALDKYLSEWMADYCLVYNIPMPAALSKVIPDLGAGSTIKEFFADSAMRAGVPLGKLIRASLSDHTPAKCRYASEIPEFVKETEEVFDTVIAEHLSAGEGLFSDKVKRTLTVKRDAFCGSLCASNIKKKLTIEMETYFRAPESRRIVTELMKGSENIVRGRHGIKSRLSAPAITGYSPIITAKTEDERAYLSLYESPQVPLTAENAAEIEAASWQNVSVLTDDSFDISSEPELPEGAITMDSLDDNTADIVPAEAEQNGEQICLTEVETHADIFSALMADKKLCSVLTAAMEGKSFAAACREVGLFAPDAASRINEMASEYIGDVILDADGSDYVFVEDYRDEISIV